MTTWTVEVSGRFEKYYRKLPPKERERIRSKRNRLAEMDNPLLHPDARALTADLRDFYRLRIGELRVIFALIRESRTIAVVNLFPRGKGY